MKKNFLKIGKLSARVVIKLHLCIFRDKTIITEARLINDEQWVKEMEDQPAYIRKSQAIVNFR